MGRLQLLSRLHRMWPWMLLPVWLLLAVVYVHSMMTDGVRYPRVQVQYAGADAYPRIIGGSIAHDDPRLLNARALALGPEDLRGFGFIGFRAHALAQGDGRETVPLLVELSGRRRETVSLSFSTSWTELPRIAFHAALVLVAVLVLRRAPTDPQSRSLYFACMAFAIWQSRFWTTSIPMAYAQSLVFYLFGGPAIGLVLRWAIQFPAELDATRRLPSALPWILGGVWALSRWNFLLGASSLVDAYAFSRGADLLLPAALLFTLGWNFAHASPVGRRRTSWVVAGVYVALVPVVGALLVATGSGFSTGPLVSRALELSRCLVLAIPLGIFIAIVRHNLFDIDRVVSVGTTYSIAVVTLGGTALYLLPSAVAGLRDATGMQPAVAQAVSAWVSAFVIFFIARRLQPSIERMLYPDRYRLQQGVHKLLQDLRECSRVGEVLELVANRVIALLQPGTGAVHTRSREGFAIMSLRGVSPARPLESDRWSELEATARVWRDDGDADAGARVLLPLTRGAELAAVVEIGAKQSGDIYTATDVALLQAVADQASAELRRLQRSRFLADVSHDLRQPVHALGLFVEALGDAAGDPARVRTLLRSLRESQSALTHMLDDVLDWSRLDSGALVTDVRAVELGPLFDRLCTEYAEQALRRGLRFRVVRTRLAVRSDVALLERILRNLVSNALRYTIRGSVLVGCRRRGDRVSIQVLDTGPGIAVGDRERMFEAFTRLDSARDRDAQGLGLGLAIVDGMVRTLGHALGVRSVVGRGTCFELDLPRVQLEATVRPVSLGAGSLAGARVYVIDDDPRIRTAMQELLQGWGCRVESFANAEAACVRLASGAEPPDVIIADYRLGEGPDGIEAVRRLRKLADRELPALLVTGEVAPEVHEVVRTSGLRHLRKPVPPAKLRALLLHLLRSPG